MKKSITVALSWATLFIMGCSPGGNSNYDQFFQLMRQSFAAYSGTSRVTRDQAAEIPYASMGYRINGGNENLLVLATETGVERLWTSASHIVIVTRDGRIVRTVGLISDISNLSSKTAGALPPPATAINAPFTSTRIEDFPDAGLYDVSLSCRAVAVAQQSIKILGQPMLTTRVDETCRSQNPKWSFVDTYWVDPNTKLVWRSRQYFFPKRDDVIETEILRPPS